MEGSPNGMAPVSKTGRSNPLQVQVLHPPPYPKSRDWSRDFGYKSYPQDNHKEWEIPQNRGKITGWIMKQ